MKKVLFLHGFTSSGECEIARTLRSELEGCRVVAPDLPLHPYKAMDLLKDMCDTEGFNLIVGSSCGGFSTVSSCVRSFADRCSAVLVSPFLRMTEFLEPRIGFHEYKSPRTDGKQSFEVTPELINGFADMEEHQFDCYDEFNRDRVWGMFWLAGYACTFPRLVREVLPQNDRFRRSTYHDRRQRAPWARPGL